MFDQEQPQYRTIRTAESGNLELLIALASMFYLYRKFEKAISVLAVAHHLEPNNRSVMELQSVILSEMRRPIETLDVISRIEALAEGLPVEISAIKKRAIRSLEAEI